MVRFLARSVRVLAATPNFSTDRRKALSCIFIAEKVGEQGYIRGFKQERYDRCKVRRFPPWAKPPPLVIWPLAARAWAAYP